jgi:heme oxygenase (mycobilin-producing)
MGGLQIVYEAADLAFVVTSEVTIPPDSALTLEQAFRERLHLVEAAPGFQRIEIWRDLARPGVFAMVSWWDCSDSFLRYMRSDEHRMSHARIPQEPDRPRGTGVRRYALLPDRGDAAPQRSSALRPRGEPLAPGGS